MTFYDLSEAERVDMTRKAVAERRTVIERWSALEMPEASPWNDRAAIAATFLADCTSVADIGCGPMQLERHLKPGTRYVPIDVVARDARTVVRDVNREPIPVLDVQGWAAIGLLEYLFDVPRLLRQVSGTLVTTYNPTDLCNDNRLSHAWINQYDTIALEAVFNESGWSVAARQTLGSQRIWKLVN